MKLEFTKEYRKQFDKLRKNEQARVQACLKVFYINPNAPALDAAVAALEAESFRAERFPRSVNLKGSSRVSIQIVTEECCREYPSRSVPADVWGILMRVASLEDTLVGTIAAYSDSTRRPSKRQKDFLDILRLVENHPKIIALLPEALRNEVKEKLNEAKRDTDH